MAYTNYAELETPSFGGANTALQFSLIPRSQSPRMQNAYMDENGDLSQRPGTIPVTATALGAAIQYMTQYKASASAGAAEEIYAASGTTLYKYDGVDTLDALTMTNALETADIYTVGFTDSDLVSRLMIGDGGDLKECDGSAVVNVTPAADDPSPAPPNGLTDVNTKGCKFIWEYSGHIFLSPGTNELFYTKRFTRDYVPTTQFFYLVRDNDFVNGCGQAFDNVCLIPMRRGWRILTGETFDNFEADKDLNTVHGVIAPRSVCKITYPDGSQTIPFLSDDGMHEVFIAVADGTSRVYATRSLMDNQIDFSKVGLTEGEKQSAVGAFDARRQIYLLSFQKAGTDYTWAYDTRNKQWYTDWLNFNAKTYVSLDSEMYFGGSTGHLHQFDDDLTNDWDDADQTTGDAIHFKRYSPAMSMEFSGFGSLWDAYVLESKQWTQKSTLDITFIFSQNTEVMDKVIKNEVFVEGISSWGEAKYANTDFTDLVNEPNEILFDFSPLSKYVQVIWENDRSEPVKILREKWKCRVSGR